MKNPWWAGLPPVTARVSCGSDRHRLRWENGQLIAVDHRDAESELVLAALGGEMSDCIKLVRTWGNHSDDLDVLATGPRSARDRLTMPKPGEMLTRGQGWASFSQPMVTVGSSTVSTRSTGGGFATTTRTAVRAGQRDPATAQLLELLELFGLGTGFQFRLMATVAANLADRAGSHRPALTAALSGRLAPEAASWLGLRPGTIDVTSYDGEGWGELALADGRLRAALPVGWLASVWAPGLAVTGLRLVTEVVSGTWPVLQVRAIRHPGTEPAPARVIRRAGRWTMAGGTP